MAATCSSHPHSTGPWVPVHPWRRSVPAFLAPDYVVAELRLLSARHCAMPRLAARLSETSATTEGSVRRHEADGLQHFFSTLRTNAMDHGQWSIASFHDLVRGWYRISALTEGRKIHSLGSPISAWLSYLEVGQRTEDIFCHNDTLCCNLYALCWSGGITVDNWHVWQAYR